MDENRNRGDSIVKGTAWNLLGNIIPILAAILATPQILNAIGISRFGVLTILWTIVGYFSIFDLGLSRALTWVVSCDRISNETQNTQTKIRTVITATFLLGSTGAIALIIASTRLAYLICAGNHELITETTNSLKFIALAIPLITVSSAIRGVLEGFSEFKISNIIRIPLGIAFAIAPYIASFFSTDLTVFAEALVLTRFLGLLMYITASIKLELFRWTLEKPSGEEFLKIIRYGGWLTLSNLISPLMVYLDRLLLPSMISIADIAFYNTPADIVQRFLIFPASLMGVLFTKFAGNKKSKSSTSPNINIIFRLVIFFALSACLFFSLTAQWFLNNWLGAAFGSKSSQITRILIVGIYLATLSQLPFTLLQGRGFARHTALIHCVELLFFSVTFKYSVKIWGLSGAAVVWSLRLFLDYLLLLACSSKTQTMSITKNAKTITFSVLGAFILGSLAIPVEPIQNIAIIAGIIMLLFSFTRNDYLVIKKTLTN